MVAFICRTLQTIHKVFIYSETLDRENLLVFVADALKVVVYAIVDIEMFLIEVEEGFKVIVFGKSNVNEVSSIFLRAFLFYCFEFEF